MSSIVVGWLGFDTAATSGVLCKSFIATTKVTTSLSASFCKAVTKIIIFDPVFQIDKELRDSTLHELTQSASPTVEIAIADSALSLVEISDIVVVGFKPQFESEMLLPLRGNFGIKSPNRSVDRPTIVLSIMQGFSIRQLEKLVVVASKDAQTPSLVVIVRLQQFWSLIFFAVDQGNLFRACGDDLTDSIKKYAGSVVRGILGSFGMTEMVPEAYLHGIALLQGSPDITGIVTTTFVEGAVFSGLPRPWASRLANGVAVNVVEPAVDSAVAAKDKIADAVGTTLRSVGSTLKSVLPGASTAAGPKSKEVGTSTEAENVENDKREGGVADEKDSKSSSPQDATSSMVVGWLGFGNMGGALGKSFIAATKQTTAKSASFCKAVTKIIIFDPVFQIDHKLRDSTLNELKQSASSNIQIVIADSALSLVEISDIVVVAVKPQYARPVLLPLRGHLGVKSPNRSVDRPTIVLSIMAGFSIRQLEKLVVVPAPPQDAQTPSLVAVVRCMPNIGSLVNKGTTAYSVDQGNLLRASSDDNPAALEFIDSAVRGILGCSGIVQAIPEGLQHTVAALQGAPAFTAIFIESLAEGAVLSGLPRPLANRFAAEIVYGASSLLVGDKPFITSTLRLKENVTSPGGTTIRGVAALEEKAMRSAVINAIVAATKRSEELGQIAEAEAKKQEGGYKVSKL